MKLRLRVYDCGHGLVLLCGRAVIWKWQSRWLPLTRAAWRYTLRTAWKKLTCP